MSVDDRVILLGDADLRWPWRNHGGGPNYRLGDSSQTVDPFPCYHHELGLVKQTLSMVEEALPLALPPKVFVLSHEPFERTNGWAAPETEWDDNAEDWIPAPGQIVMAGKRIPLHPAMTRYLVAHEYGHHVEFALLRGRGHGTHEDVVKDEYRELRGSPENVPYGGRTWHISPGELLANDFRCLVAKQEVEFWPHPGYEHPGKVPEVVEWWANARAELLALVA